MTGPTIWDTEHFPVLKAAVEGLNADHDGFGVRAGDIARGLGMSDEAVVSALRRLSEDGLVGVKFMSPAPVATVREASGEAQRIVGAWPTSETAADRIVAALEAIAVHGDTEETRSRAQKALDALSGTGRAVAVGVGTALITGAIQ